MASSSDKQRPAHVPEENVYTSVHWLMIVAYAVSALALFMLIKSAVESVNGDLSDKNAVRDALRSANYESVRGPYTYGNNGMPIQNFYLREVVEDDEGRWTTKVVETVFENHQDPYASDCKL